ncbi:MAG TPA: ABC transporter ATP-binding protein, partial [Acetobacteraceae bacterium]|nr:ABC transporter ATP-binding protein [Acetobacteraceae bacterium]
VIAGFHTIGLIIYGSILLVVLLLVPEGAIGLGRRVIERLRGLGRRGAAVPAEGRPAPEAALGGRPGTDLAVEGVSKSYAGVAALKDVSFAVVPGTIHALIGPNGAGKSTLINLVAGLYRADAGRLRIGGVDVTEMPAHRRARMGLARSFQNLQLIAGLTVIENVMLGLPPRGLPAVAGFGRWLTGRPHEAEERARAHAILAFLGIADLADQRPGGLPYGHRKLCELARTIAQDPAVMLLDEPVAGLNPREAAEIASALRRLRDAGKTILLVEHNMEFVMGISDRVTVLDYGVVIADGSPSAVQADARVIAAYLGTEEAAPA